MHSVAWDMWLEKCSMVEPGAQRSLLFGDQNYSCTILHIGMHACFHVELLHKLYIVCLRKQEMLRTALTADQ